MELVASRALLKAIVAATTAAAPTASPLATGHVGLTTTSAIPGQDLTMDQLTEPDYTGYGRVALTGATWGAPTFNADGTCVTLNSTPVPFKMTDALKPTTVIGVFIADADVAGNLLAYGAFDNPISLVDAEQAIHYTPAVRLGPDLNLGDSCVMA